MSFIQTLLESLLLEGKIDDINNQFPHIPNEVKSNILQRMPNPKSPDTNHYQWLLKQHSLGHLTDSHDIHDILSKFSKNKGTLKKPKLNQYSSINELHQAVNGLEAAPISKKQQAAKDTTILYSSPTMIVRQHHSHQSAIEAAKLPDSNQVKATVKSAEGEQIGKANWCVSADSTEGYTRFNHYTNGGTNPVYSIDTIYPDGSTRRHIYVTDNSKRTPEFRNEKQDGSEYDLNYTKFAKENPEIMKTPIAIHFNPEKRKQIHLNDFLNGNVEHISNDYRYNENDQHAINTHYEKINKVRNASVSEINDIIKDKKMHIHLASNPNINKTHIDELMKNENTHFNLLANKGMTIGNNNIQKIVDGNSILAKKLLIDKHFTDLTSSQYKPLMHSEWGEYIAKKDVLPSEYISELIKNPNNHSELAKREDLNDDHISEILEHPNSNIDLRTRNYLNSKRISELLKNPDNHSILSYRKDLKPEHITELIKNPYNHASLSYREDLTPEHITELIKNPYNHRVLAQRKDLKPEHITELIKNPYNHRDLVQREDLKPEHITELIKNPDNHTDLVSREDFTPSHITELLKNPDYPDISHTMTALFSKNLEPRHIDELLKKPDMDKVLLLNKNLNDESKKYLNDKVTNDVKEFVKSNI